MKQHHPARAAFGGGDERRAIFERGPGLFGKLRPQPGENLARNGDLARSGQAKERAFAAKVADRLRRAPCHGAAYDAPTAAQGDRQKRVFILHRRGGGGEIGAPRQPWPGETHQKAAAFHPFQEIGGFLFGHGADIGEKDRIGVREQQVADAALDHIRRPV